MNTTIVNYISFENLFPYPLTISALDWYKLPEWQKFQLEQDNNNVKLSKSYKVEFSDKENNTITFRYDFKQSRLLYRTPKDWVLPKSRFNINTDFKRIIYSIGESWSLFKFINQTNNGQPSYKSYEKRTITKFINYLISMDITLFKTSKASEGVIKLSLPTIKVDYSDYILDLTNKESGTNFSDYYQNIYFPMMLSLGYANYEKYEDYSSQFDLENNPGWTYLTVKVNYIKIND